MRGARAFRRSHGQSNRAGVAADRAEVTRAAQGVRIVLSVGVAAGTWQTLVDHAGSGAWVFYMARSVLVSAEALGAAEWRARALAERGPERLDFRARLHYALDGMNTLVIASWAAEGIVLDSRRLRPRRTWYRRLARQSLWKRLTTFYVHGPRRRHGRPFTVVAGIVTLLSGVAHYRRSADDGVLINITPVVLALAGRVFPMLPFFGLAWPRHVRSERRVEAAFRIVCSVTLAGAFLFALRSFRYAVMSQEAYDQQRRRSEQPVEGAT